MSWYNDEYLRSDHWTHLKLKKSKVAKLCFCCGQKPDQRNFHHVRYRQIFDVTINDLRLVCEDCHKFYHACKREKPYLHERILWKWARKLKRAIS